MRVPHATLTEDTRAIEALLAFESDAWNRADAKAFSARFVEDGGFTNALGMTYYGREAFEQRHRELFETAFKGSSNELVLAKLRFIRADVAVVDVDAGMKGYSKLPPGIHAGPDGVLRSKLQVVLVKENGEWWISAFHNVGVFPLPARP